MRFLRRFGLLLRSSTVSLKKLHEPEKREPLKETPGMVVSMSARSILCTSVNDIHDVAILKIFVVSDRAKVL